MVAGQRPDSLNNKLDRNPDFKEGYSVVLQEMEDKCVIQEVSVTDQSRLGPCHEFCLIHRAVVRDIGGELYSTVDVKTSTGPSEHSHQSLTPTANLRHPRQISDTGAMWIHGVLGNPIYELA